MHLGAVSTAKYFVPHAIAAFSKRYPKIEIKLTIGNREEIREAMLRYYPRLTQGAERPGGDFAAEAAAENPSA